MSTTPSYQLISQPAQLSPLFAALDRSEEISLDTEADNLFRYKTRMCLLQILADGQIFLVDLVADLPLGDLWPRLAAKPLIMHGSDYDLRLMYELCEFRPQSLFDTMFAAQLLSIPRFGLAALLEHYFGVKLDKDHQKANWSRRPLERGMLDYAALDVYYLPELRDRLREELVRLGRLEWMEQKCRWQIEVARDGFAAPDENNWRIGGAEKLRGRGLAVLHALWHWREGWAEKLNTPPFKVTGNDLLMRLARAAEEGASPVELLKVNLGRRHDRLASSLAEAVHRGFETDPRTLPRRERRRDFSPMSPEELSRQDRIKAQRDRFARELNLDPTLIATRSQLALLARDPDGIDGQLLPWQAGLFKSDPAWSSLNPAVSESANIARHLPLMAARDPDQPALKIPRGRTRDGRIDYLVLSFRELDTEVDVWVDRLNQRGVTRGDRVLVMVRQGLPLIAAAFALFKLGAVPVIIDPGMGRQQFLACVARSRPRVLLGIPLAQVMSHVFRTAFASVQVRVWVSGSSTARQSSGGPASLRAVTTVSSAPTDLAAILFTSGSTGAPKGVCYEHGMFDAQVRLIRDTYTIQPGEVDLPMLPIFALFNPALGMTTIVPEIDPSRPASVDPAKIVQAIRQENVTSSFGSPTLWRKISRHCQERQLTLPTLRRVLMAGAPVPPDLFAAVQSILPNGTAHSPYGATEALPVASISAKEVLGAGQSQVTIAKDQATNPLVASQLAIGTSAATATGHGTCVGRPLPGITVRIIPLSDEPITTLADGQAMPVGEIGEIIVSGPVVTKTYDALPEATAGAKIQITKSKSQKDTGELDPVDSVGIWPLESGISAPSGAKNHGINLKSHGVAGDRESAVPVGTWSLALGTSAPSGAVWHRLGDLGYLDAQGRLWFCGRKAERVKADSGLLHTEQVEPIFNAHPKVARTALIGVGHNGHRPALVVEPVSRDVVATPSLRRKLVRELRVLGARYPHTDRIRLVYLHPHFPVDVRHNAKIHRLALARWATGREGYEMDKREVPASALQR